MGESAYRDSDEALRATLATMRQRAGEMDRRIDWARLARFYPERLATLDKMARAARKSLDKKGSTDALARACDAHRVFVAELEAAVATVVDKVHEADILERERKSRVGRKVQVVSLLIGMAIVPINVVVSFGHRPLFIALAVLQTMCGAVAFLAFSSVPKSHRGSDLLAALAVLLGLGGPLGILLAYVGDSINMGGLR